MRLIFEFEVLIKAILDENILFGKVTHHLDPEIRKILVNGKFSNGDSTFHSGP